MNKEKDNAGEKRDEFTDITKLEDYK